MLLHRSFRKITPKRPVVVRKKDKVQTCYLYKGTKECLGSLCFWPRIGTCKFFNRIKGRAK